MASFSLPPRLHGALTRIILTFAGVLSVPRVRPWAPEWVGFPAGLRNWRRETMMSPQPCRASPWPRPAFSDKAPSLSMNRLISVKSSPLRPLWFKTIFGKAHLLFSLKQSLIYLRPHTGLRPA